MLIMPIATTNKTQKRISVHFSTNVTLLYSRSNPSPHGKQSVYVLLMP